MTMQKPTGTDTDGAADAPEPTADIPERWDFRLDRTGLMVAAGRYLQLRISLGLLIVVVGLACGWSTVHWHWLTL
ncbi:hypothetical protein [Streptomyces sp. MBT62]|uniref:hypothetical protein n=1 Tax=Streptomyces sp. MBT62 TaxID=2800410 RepID=UPI0019094D91|nr:hypothetical protein [Streptomyces sp. MBT62]MBK3570705.1 hypothetical protein [Streptomyces sp. MBT62]